MQKKNVKIFQALCMISVNKQYRLKHNICEIHSATVQGFLSDFKWFVCRLGFTKCFV